MSVDTAGISCQAPAELQCAIRLGDIAAGVTNSDLCRNNTLCGKVISTTRVRASCRVIENNPPERMSITRDEAGCFQCNKNRVVGPSQV